MRKLLLSTAGAGLVGLALAAGVAAADPTPTPATERARDRDTVPALVGLSQAQVMALRHDGLSLAQIAERQKVDPQKLIDALVARWTERIEARLDNGALSQAQATQLKSQVQTQAKSMVNKVTTGGMKGAAVGAGPQGRAGTAGGRGTQAGGARGGGTGTCDGTGPHGAGQP